MTKDDFSTELRELYDGELLGEAFFECLLCQFEDLEQSRKLTIALQLETETKAKLRPFIVAAGMALNDDGEARNTGKELAAGFSGKSWGEVMSGLLDILGPAVQRYQEIFDSSPAEFKELANSMLIHEKALLNFVELELEGKPNSTNAMSDQLVYGLGKAT